MKRTIVSIILRLLRRALDALAKRDPAVAAELARLPEARACASARGWTAAPRS